jgi:methionyl-tRNA formyltransferase
MKLKKIFFLLDPSNLWIEKFLKKSLKKFSKKYNYIITKNPKIIKNSIVFVLSYTKILDIDFIKSNKKVLIIHPSKLPKDKGFAPVQNQILKNKKLIHICILEASDKVDSGPVIYRDTFLLLGHELSNEIRKKQAISTFKLISKFLKNYPKYKAYKQKGTSNFNKRRGPKASELNINKSIKSQFNLLRICDNDCYPAFFEHKKNIYVIKIFKKKQI